MPVATAAPRPWLALLGRLASFGVIGALNTGLDILIFVLLTGPFGIPPLLANVASFSTGAASSFMLNGIFTFGMRGERLATASRIGRFALITLVTLCVSQVALALCLGYMPALAAKVASVFATFVTGFVLSSRFVYTRTPAAASSPSAPDGEP